MKVLVTGANGQLGEEIQSIASHFSDLKFVFADSKMLDITAYSEVDDFVRNHNIEAIINCAAYTQVDKAEDEPLLAEKVNVIGVSNLVEALKKVRGKLIHISTDYVFNGQGFIPYTEQEATSPIGVYGKTKLKGEEVIIDSDINGIVIRTSWLYSEFGNNFVKTMMRLGKEKEMIKVISDQIGTPTYAKDLAKACLEIISNNEHLNKKGSVYHFSNEGVASWYDFADAIMEISNEDCLVLPIETKDYPTKAVRPQYSILNKSKIKNDFNVAIPNWRVSLKKCIENSKN